MHRSQRDMREHNERDILDCVRRNAGLTQAELAAAVGLSRAAVAKLIGSDPAQKNRETTKGSTNGSAGSDGVLWRVLTISEERPARVGILPHIGCVASIALGYTHLRGRLCDLAGAESCSQLPDRPGIATTSPAEALAAAAELLQELLDAAGREPHELAGVALGMPFPIQKLPATSKATPDTYRVILPAGLTQSGSSAAWGQVSLPADLYQPHRLAWSAPTSVASDAQLGAVAELDALLNANIIPEMTRSTATTLYVKCSTRITAGVITHGELHRGADGLAGQFAHTPLWGRHQEELDDIEDCPDCGRICLHSIASLPAIIRRAQQDPKQLGDNAEQRASHLVQLARQSITQDGETQDDHPTPEARAKKALTEAARQLGRALGAAVNMLNPQVVVVGGAFKPQEYEYLAPTILAGLRETAYGPAQDTRIQPGQETGRAALVGGVSLALQSHAAAYLLRTARSSRVLTGAKPETA